MYQCWRERRDETTIYATTTAVPKVTNNTVRSPSRVSQRPIDTTNGKAMKKVYTVWAKI